MISVKYLQSANIGTSFFSSFLSRVFNALTKSANWFISVCIKNLFMVLRLSFVSHLNQKLIKILKNSKKKPWLSQRQSNFYYTIFPVSMYVLSSSFRWLCHTSDLKVIGLSPVLGSVTSSAAKTMLYSSVSSHQVAYFFWLRLDYNWLWNAGT